jgi:hypothetical protein
MASTKTLANKNRHKSMWAEYDDPLSKKMNGMTAGQIIRKYSVKKLADMFTGEELLALAARYDVERDDKEKQSKKRRDR